MINSSSFNVRFSLHKSKIRETVKLTNIKDAHEYKNNNNFQKNESCSGKYIEYNQIIK